MTHLVVFLSFFSLGRARILLVLSEDLPSAQEQQLAAEELALGDQGEDQNTFLAVDTVYEATVEEVITKERSHPMGIKVRVVGGKAGRVARVLAAGENSDDAAAEIGAACLPVAPNRGIRSQLLAASVGSKSWTPYSTTSEKWVPKGPAAKALAALEALEADGALDDLSASSRSSKKKESRYGEAGIKKLRRAVASQKESDSI